MRITSKYLIIPVNPQAQRKKVLFYDKDGRLVYDFDAQLDALTPMYSMYYDMARFMGMELSVSVEPEMDIAFAMTDTKPMAGVYNSCLRPTVHFTAAYGWINDPNGLVYHDGVYHLYFQHNPMGACWGNMHWGHATSPDLIHWTECDLALYPDETGTMYSGSGIVDTKNASGLSPEGKTILFYYTAAPQNSRLSEEGDKKYVQCLAYSTDGGKTLTKYEGNPVVQWIEDGNRDPKVVWCEELGVYLMALYIARDEYQLFESDDLITWKNLQTIRIPESSECPDFYPLTADDGERKWVFTDADEIYAVGHMDAASRQFVIDNEAKKFHYGTNSYAAQTYSGIPDRCVKIAWHTVTKTGTQFCCEMGIPMEISLVNVNGEYYMKALPVAELDGIVRRTDTYSGVKKTPLSKTAAHDITIKVPKDSEDFTLTVFGSTFEVKPSENLFSFGDKAMPISRTDGDVEIRLITDTVSVECFLDGGLVYAVFGNILDKNLNYLTVTTDKAEITVKELMNIH
ncbi:MAG: glycoside hydrolase family 32 protein [Ruminococcaceae bacterium]|nr:glycoside hydrolase family 32 protein [Oscillospiraceae bacterium]